MLLVCIALYVVFAFYGDDSDADVAMEASSVVKAAKFSKGNALFCIMFLYHKLTVFDLNRNVIGRT